MRQMLGVIFLAILWLEVKSTEYYGVKLGKLSNSSFGLESQVFLANGSLLQIRRFSLGRTNKPMHFHFYFSTSDDVAKADHIYQIIESKTGPYARRIDPNLDSGFDREDLLVKIPQNHKKWQFFGVVAEKEWFYLSAVRVNNKEAPEPYCCIRDPLEPKKGIKGTWYNVGAEPIQVIDAQTLRLPSFTFEGQKPPDGWIFAGRGKVKKETGKKAYIIGRDSKALHCPMRELYKGSFDIIAKLADDQTVYDIDYLSVYCYAVGVNFGHVPVNLNPNLNPVPPVIPPIRNTPPPADIQGWDRPLVQLLPNVQNPVDLSFTLGPPGGSKARAMRSICDNLDYVWYVNGDLTPEIWVQRDITYRLKVNGGRKHPLYITSENTGGWTQKPFSEKASIKNFAGGDGSAVGSKCEYKPINDRRAHNPDAFDDFDAYSHFLHLQCVGQKRPYQLVWRPDSTTPDEVYYGSFDEYNMGGPIRVCNSIQGPASNPKCF